MKLERNWMLIIPKQVSSEREKKKICLKDTFPVPLAKTKFHLHYAYRYSYSLPPYRKREAGCNVVICFNAFVRS